MAAAAGGGLAEGVRAAPGAAGRAAERRALGVYAAGECANSLMVNGLNGFALLYYTEALGLAPALASSALAVSVFWEALSEPLMGFVTDRTRTRWGSRLPWLVAGGLAMSLAFVAVWAVPTALRASHTAVFGYLVIVNLLLRTGLTVFFVPYLATGFDLVPSYEGRARLQAARQVANMAANFAGPAFAWVVFFGDRPGADGRIVSGTRTAANYLNMGLVFAGFSLLFVAVTAWGARARARDNRGEAVEGGDPLHAFVAQFRPVITDPLTRQVSVLVVTSCCAMVLLSSLQSYIYIHFMAFDPGRRAIAHGATIVGMAAGGAVSALVARRFDKKGAATLGAVLSVAASLALALAFLPSEAARRGAYGFGIFVALQGAFWFGCGIVLPIETAMIGDAAELAARRSGRGQEGAYAAAFSLSMRMAIAFSLFASGGLLQLAGFDPAGTPTAAATWRLGLAAFVGPAALYLAFLIFVRRYRLDRATFTRRMEAAV